MLFDEDKNTENSAYIHEFEEHHTRPEKPKDFGVLLTKFKSIEDLSGQDPPLPDNPHISDSIYNKYSSTGSGLRGNYQDQESKDKLQKSQSYDLTGIRGLPPSRSFRNVKRETVNNSVRRMQSDYSAQL